MRDKYIKESKRIENNCVYTAEAHHIIALEQQKSTIKWQIIPSTITAILVSIKLIQTFHIYYDFLTAIAAVTAVIGNAKNPQKEYYDHLIAAKNFTALKNDSRALWETFSQGMTDKELRLSTQHLLERYNTLCSASPLTSEKAFEKARQRIKDGVHDPD